MRDPPEELSVHLGKDGQEILNELCRTAIHAVSAGRNYKEAKKIFQLDTCTGRLYARNWYDGTARDLGTLDKPLAFRSEHR